MKLKNINANISSIFFEKAEILKDKKFLFYPQRKISFTYSEINEKIRKTSVFLKNQGIKKGDCINILLPNCPDFIISFLAILSIGAVANPVNTGLKPDAISYILNHSEGKMLIISSLFSEKIEHLSDAPTDSSNNTVCIDEHPKYLKGLCNNIVYQKNVITS